jgi:arginyl-tRNA synthetase
VSSPDSKARLAGLLEQAVRAAFPDAPATTVDLDRPKSREHGDFATNVALQLARHVGRKSREVAEAIVKALPASGEIARCEVAGPGFINITLASGARFAVVDEILRAGTAFGRSQAHKDRKIMVEFVSANPTGPLHVGHGRQAALGDAISTLLEWQGWRVTREFYYNDAGNQIANLALSVQVRIQEAHGDAVEMPKDGYMGEYIREIAREYVSAHFGDAAGKNLEQIRRFAVEYLRKEQDIDLNAFGVKVRLLLPGELALHRRQGGRDRGGVEEGRPHVRVRGGALAAHHRLRRRQGPRDAQVRRHVHVLPARRRLSPRQVPPRVRGWS